jgi:uncharacterized membrane protein
MLASNKKGIALAGALFLIVIVGVLVALVENILCVW